MNLVVCHEFYGRVGENTKKRRGMALEQASEPPVLVYFLACAQCTAPRPFMNIGIYIYISHNQAGEKQTCIFLKVWVGGLEENFDSVKRSNDGLCL